MTTITPLIARDVLDGWARNERKAFTSDAVTDRREKKVASHSLEPDPRPSQATLTPLKKAHTLMKVEDRE
jgi:hypothetical protein